MAFEWMRTPMTNSVRVFGRLDEACARSLAKHVVATPVRERYDAQVAAMNAGFPPVQPEGHEAGPNELLCLCASMHAVVRACDPFTLVLDLDGEFTTEGLMNLRKVAETRFEARFPKHSALKGSLVHLSSRQDLKRSAHIVVAPFAPRFRSLGDGAAFAREVDAAAGNRALDMAWFPQTRNPSFWSLRLAGTCKLASPERALSTRPDEALSDAAAFARAAADEEAYLLRAWNLVFAEGPTLSHPNRLANGGGMGASSSGQIEPVGPLFKLASETIVAVAERSGFQIGAPRPERELPHPRYPERVPVIVCAATTLLCPNLKKFDKDRDGMHSKDPSKIRWCVDLASKQPRVFCYCYSCRRFSTHGHGFGHRNQTVGHLTEEEAAALRSLIANRDPHHSSRGEGDKGTSEPGGKRLKTSVSSLGSETGAAESL